jgi:hypothetical protein
MTDTPPNQTPPIQPATDADLMQTNAMLTKRVAKLEDQLKLSIDALAKINDKQKAQAAADKADLIDHLIADSKGKLTKDTLNDLDIRELKSMKIMADTLGSSQDDMFASVAALQTERDNKKILGIDYFDPKTQEWRVK